MKQRSRFPLFLVPGIPIPSFFFFSFSGFFFSLQQRRFPLPRRYSRPPSIARAQCQLSDDGRHYLAHVPVCVFHRRYLTDGSAPEAWGIGGLGWASFQVRRPAFLGSSMPLL